MIIDRANGWLKGVRTVVSPNCDERPRDGDLSLIVIHGISLPQGQFGGAWIDRFFLNELPAEADPYFATIHALKVSAHVLIDRGGNLTQYVAFNHRAWHAGKSEYCGRTACNDFSVGIELEGTDDLPYQPEQYESLARLIRSLRQAYPSLRDAAIVGHSDISPGRKTDPGLSFDWQHLRSLLADPAALR
ncbi:MAG TPA: 1,6-anhydro-N-acetylmuramyl-L-alanine amidase AmpD [Gammaproteobacteria bacterium]|nr:1,6-anhydro-N-acetylmuramyl-L-alanine amidase AmpD [Gammaproteobacteria bacterium]